MADISKDELRKEITAILKDADLETTSAKKIRQQIEEKLDIDLTERKKEIDDLVMEHLQDKQDGGKKKKKDSKNDVKSEESEDGEEDEDEASEEEEEEEEEEKKPAKRGPPKKSATKRSKGSSDDDESGSDDDASDEEYNPKKVAKTSPKKGKPGKKMKKKGSDSDSDADWEQTKKSTGGAKKGGGKGKGGYTRAITLSPELATLVDAEKMARHEVVKKVWHIIKERNLYDPKNKQFAICDDELLKVFGVKRFRTFGMMKYLKNHFLD